MINELITINLIKENEILKTRNEVLEERNKFLENENETLMEKNKSLKDAYKIVEGQLKWLSEQVRLSRKQRFGASSEKSIYDYIQTNVFNEEEERFEYPEGIEEQTAIVKEHVRRTRLMTDKLPPDMPVEEVVHEIPEAERVCPKCDGKLHRIGQEIIRDELKVVPAKAVIVRHIRNAYGCRICENKAESATIVKAPTPPPLIAGSFASPEAVAHIMVQKYVMGSPLYRQEQEFLRNGIGLSRQTMTSWLIRCSEDWLTPIYQMLRSRLLKNDVLFADETELQVLREPEKKPQSKSYLWVYRTGAYAEFPIILSEYQPSRGAEHVKNFLYGYHGYLHCDGYKAYHDLPEDITVVGCWSHARRPYDNAIKILPEKDREGSDSIIGKRYCDRLFEIERRLAELKPEVRHAKRLELATPVLDEYHRWLRSFKERDMIGKNLFGKAVNYSLEQWRYLKNYLLDGRLELSTNRIERTVKPFVMSRKNFLFSVSQRGAKASAVTFSLLETAIESKLNPYDYLVYVFRNAPNMASSNLDDIESLLPHNVADRINSS